MAIKTTRKNASVRARTKTPAAPCEKCKGFSIPGRSVASVARAANGRFKRAKRAKR